LGIYSLNMHDLEPVETGALLCTVVPNPKYEILNNIEIRIS